MSKDKYNKKDLTRFKKEIQRRIDELNGNMDGIRDDLNIDSKVGICQSKDSFFGETEPDRMPVAPYLDFKWKSWQEGGVGASEMEAATLFTLSQIKRIEAGAILAIETSDKETIKKMTEIVLESITYMEGERNVI